ncbi:uncharacterized protein LOC123240715 [Gracilinanus agilis]|uniref:uncharacterized protein LOC123240715 n=1 Tax=Gracilinanus agilis TaxID=191870 RepID=UPI001CFD45ED|nr:uncharacterized protein LOC123240715 [Gracilinanus agilis]
MRAQRRAQEDAHGRSLPYRRRPAGKLESPPPCLPQPTACPFPYCLWPWPPASEVHRDPGVRQRGNPALMLQMRGDRRTQVREGGIQLGDPGDRGSQLRGPGEWGRHFGEQDVQFVTRGDKEMQPGNSTMELRDRGVYLWERSVQLGDREERARQLGDRGERGLPLWERGVQLGSRGERRIQLGERGVQLGDSVERGFHLWERGIQLEDREDSRGPLGEREAQPGDRGAELGQGGAHLEDRGERGLHLWDGGQMMQLGDREETGGMLGELQGRGRPAGAREDRAGARKRPRSSSEEEDWELLSRFRAVCGPELAGLVAEELTFARQHGVRGFRWTGTGYTLQDGTSDFLLDAALTRCSCSIHAARHLPCRHLFAARLVVGAALFHMDLLRDSWGGAPEP